MEGLRASGELIPALCARSAANAAFVTGPSYRVSTPGTLPRVLRLDDAAPQLAPQVYWGIVAKGRQKYSKPSTPIMRSKGNVSILSMPRPPQSEPVAVARPRLSAALAAKLTAPSAVATQVLRKALCNNVCAADTARLVLVHAPAGFGKTTAMLQLRARLEAQGAETAWLTLDQSDNDAARFLNCFSLAICNLNPAPIA